MSEKNDFQADNIVYSGVRSSTYGITNRGLLKFPDVEVWGKVMDSMLNNFPNSTPCFIWIVGVVNFDGTCLLEFPSSKEYPYVTFSKEDKHEKFLDYFDKKGIKVFLQVESALADIEMLTDVVLSRYGSHPCVAGFGIDVEWFGASAIDDFNEFKSVDDNIAEKWETKVKSYNPDYKLFLKHWLPELMPTKYRGDIVFVNDSQIFNDLDDQLKEFTHWANLFYPNHVYYQIGYVKDKNWWEILENPPKVIGDAIASRIKQECGIFWVDFTMREVFVDN